MSAKRVARKPKMKRRTKFTILAVVNLTWYCIAVIVAAGIYVLRAEPAPKPAPVPQTG